MKVWFDKTDVDFNRFTSEQFLLLPLFSRDVIEKDNDFKNNNWSEGIQGIVEYVSKIEDADAVIYPKKFDEGVIKYIQSCTFNNKKLYCFYNDDNSQPIDENLNLNLYRTSLYRSKKKKNEFSLPAWSQDLFSVNQKQRFKNKIPTVGFCGYISHPVRSESISVLNKNLNIKRNFVIRDAFWGGSPHNAVIREEYINNIVNSDLVLCARGAGNFSYRLYETLSCGRIPVFVDTDCVLPCEDIIDWSQICIIVDSPVNLNDAINEFWNKISEKEYNQMQINARKIYQKYISPDGFTRYLSYNI